MKIPFKETLLGEPKDPLDPGVFQAEGLQTIVLPIRVFPRSGPAAETV